MVSGRSDRRGGGGGEVEEANGRAVLDGVAEGALQELASGAVAVEVEVEVVYGAVAVRAAVREVAGVEDRHERARREHGGARTDSDAIDRESASAVGRLDEAERRRQLGADPARGRGHGGGRTLLGSALLLQLRPVSTHVRVRGAGCGMRDAEQFSRELATVSPFSFPLRSRARTLTRTPFAVHHSMSIPEQVAQNYSFQGTLTKYKGTADSLGGLETNFNVFLPQQALAGEKVP